MKPIGDDLITLHQLALQGRVGCTAEERAFPQRLTVDIEVAVESTRAARSGKLEDTVCYLTLKEAVQKLVLTREWSLLEQLAEDICALILETFPSARQVKLRIRKYVFPEVDSVSLEVTRERDSAFHV